MDAAVRPLTREDVARLRPQERKALLEQVGAMIATGELSLADAARLLRSTFLRMSRTRFAKVVKVSPRAIAELEDDREANPRLQTLARVFAPFGGKVALTFPALAPEPAPDEATERVRAALRASLAASKRARRSR